MGCRGSARLGRQEAGRSVLGLVALAVALVTLLLVVFPAAPAEGGASVGAVRMVAHGIANPAGIALGPDRNLWFTSTGSDWIGRITPAGAISAFTGVGIRGPRGITAGPDGNLWFTNVANNSVGRITREGVVSNFTGEGIGWPGGITAGADGNLWFTNSFNNSIGRITTAGVVSNFTGSGINGPEEIAAGPDGNLWFTSYGSIGRITLSGVVSSFTAPGIQRPRGISAGPDGNLWFTDTNWDDGRDWIGRITPAGSIATFEVTTMDAPASIATGPDGNLWFTASRSIGRISTGGVITNVTGTRSVAPTRITAGPDGNLWFTDYAPVSDGLSTGGSINGLIGRITPTGVLTSFKGTGISEPSAITRGGDGNLWFSNSGNDSIGRITPTGEVTNFASPDIDRPQGVAWGPDGNLWFTNLGSDSVGRMTPSGVVSTFSVPSVSGVDWPRDIAAGQDGNLWFTNEASWIGRITPAGVVSKFTGSMARPSRIAAGPDGNMWFTNNLDSTIGRISPAGVVWSTVGSHLVDIKNPVGIAAGADGNMWFTNSDGSIGRSTLEGATTRFTGTGTTYLEAIAPGPDGNMWFAGGDRVGRVTPAGVISSFPAPTAHDIIAGPDGNMWFTGNGAIGLVGTGVPGPPGVPQAVSAAPGDGQASVSWTPPLDVSGSVVTGYVVTASPGGRTCAWAGGPLRCIVSGLTNGTSYTFDVVAVNVHGGGVRSAPSNPVVPTVSVAFHPVTPARILDSRPGATTVDPYTSPWGPGQTRDVAATGVGSVPAGADAVVLNVTVTGTTAAGYLTIWPAGGPKPLASSLNWAPGQTVPNAVTVMVGDGGDVSIFNPNGSTHVIVDVVGYYDGEPGDGFTSLTPARILDSRPAGLQVGPFGSPWGAGQTREVTVTGVGGVPPGANAVVVNVTVTGTTGHGYLTIWPAGQPQPLASSLNWAPGQTIPNAVTVKVGALGALSMFNAVGSAHVIVDVVGWFGPGTGQPFHPLPPTRVQDSRSAGPPVGFYDTPWGPAVSRDVQVGGAGGTPADATAALLNVTVTGTTAPGYLTIWPAGHAAPLASSLNWASGQTIPNAVTAKLGASGRVSVTNPAGNVHVIADVSGWYG